MRSPVLLRHKEGWVFGNGETSGSGEHNQGRKTNLVKWLQRMAWGQELKVPKWRWIGAPELDRKLRNAQLGLLASMRKKV